MKLATELERARKTYEVLLLEYERQQRGLKTPSRERVPTAQLSLLDVLAALGRFQHAAPDAPSNEEAPSGRSARSGRGRGGTCG